MNAAAREMLDDVVERRVADLVREADCARRRSRRPLVRVDEDDDAVDGRPVRRARLLEASDVDAALRWRGEEGDGPLYATSAGTRRDEETVDLNAYVNDETDARPPSEIAAAAHWLAVDGAQPAVPRNPATDDRDRRPRRGRRAVPATAPPRPVSEAEDDDRDDLVVDDDDDDAATDGGGGLTVGRLLPRLLPDELHHYYRNVASRVERGSERERERTLASVSTDRGLQELVPFFAKFVHDRINNNLAQVERCRAVVRLADALLRNPHLALEMHLHQILTPVITCVVAQNLGTGGPNENDWALREEAAATLVRIHNKFGAHYTRLGHEILSTLCRAMSPDQPLETRYGGVVGLSLFGPKVVDAFLLPVARDHWERWEATLSSPDVSEDESFRVRQCQEALLTALGVYMRAATARDEHEDDDDGGHDENDLRVGGGAGGGGDSQRRRTEGFEEVFGERWIPFQAAYRSEYANCVL